MTQLVQPDRSLLQQWLSDMHMENHLCGECEGLHLDALQSLQGVVNSRIFLQPDSILLSTELEVRPMAILPLASETTRMNMDYPHLKVFLDVVDDATPQLVLMSHLLVSAGISHAQFADFLNGALDATQLLAQECLELDFLLQQPDPALSGISQSVH